MQKYIYVTSGVFVRILELYTDFGENISAEIVFLR